MMKKTILTLLATAALTAGASAQMLILNEVYPGGGSTSATAAYHEDFIELLNTGLVSIDVTGFTLAYGASTQAAGNFPTAIGTLGASALSGSSIVPAGGFLLINTGSVSTGGATNPAGDFQFTTGASLSATTGSVRLSNASGTVLDILGYGASNNFEGTGPATTPANIGLSLNRTAGIDTNNNSVDFTSATPSPMSSVPEPSTYATLGLGILGVLSMLRARRRAA